MKKPSIIKTLFNNAEYILYYSRILLKANVAGSYLGFVWLILSPLLFMLIYSFIVMVVFKSSIENFSVFVLIGLTAFSLFANTVMMGATAIVRNKAIFEQVYFHKSVYPAIYLLSETYKFIISLGLIFIFIIFLKIPITWHIIEVVPILLVEMLFTFGCSLIVSHFGVYIFDLRNILDFILRFLFFLTPIMWAIERIDARLWSFLKLNPLQIIISAYRSCLMYHSSPDYFNLLLVTILSIVLIQIGYLLINKYEDEYARVI